MPEFEKSRWAESEFSQNYRNDADAFLPLRNMFFGMAESIYAFFVKSNSESRVLDLGCGDGLFVQGFLESFSPVSITLMDASEEMLDAAKKRLGENKNLKFIQASFQDLLAGKSLNGNFDFVFSSLAVHHLTLKEKKQLYAYIYNLLSPGGWFVHYDVVDPSAERTEKLYLALWRQWIAEHSDKETAEKLSGIPDQYKGNQDNLPDTLWSQLDMLKDAGFQEVDCYLKYGVFALFGGVK